MQLITAIASDFFASPSSPQSLSIMAMGIIGYGWTWRVPTTPTTPSLSSSNKALASSPKCKFTMRCLAPAGERFLARAQKGYVRRRMGGNSNPRTEAEKQGEGPANSLSNDPLPL